MEQPKLLHFETAIINSDQIAALYEEKDEKRSAENKPAYVVIVQYINNQFPGKFVLPEGKRLKDFY